VIVRCAHDVSEARKPAMNRVDYHGEFWVPVTPGRLSAMIERFDQFES